MIVKDAKDPEWREMKYPSTRHDPWCNEWMQVNHDELASELDDVRFQRELDTNYLFRTAIDAIDNDEGIVTVVYRLCKLYSNEERVLIEKYRQLPRRWQLLMQALMMPKASEKERGNDGE